MGKTLSKAGMRLNTRRQRSQVISMHQDRLSPPKAATSGPVLSRAVEADVTINTLRIQKDEFSIYKGKLARVLQKEMGVLKQLLLDGKRDAAALLLKKKRFQEYILTESEKELLSVLSQITKPEQYRSIKTEADNCINRNSDTLKRIQMLLSVEDIDHMLLEGDEGQGKQQEVFRILLLATVGERKKFDHGLDLELNSMMKSIEKEMEEEVQEDQVQDEEEVHAAAIEVEERNLIDLDDYINREAGIVEKEGLNPPLASDEETEPVVETKPVVVPVGSEDLVFEAKELEEESKVESAAEETEGGASGIDGDDEKSASGSDSATAAGSASEVSSKMFPDVPTEEITPAALPIPEPEIA